mmetsp:Transcript_48283/g.58446  ORF Transcript_48283/g.58446 Transcript_48283/m.58446 type:complete len:90 (+) Transcript_48283:106-375(+)
MTDCAISVTTTMALSSTYSVSLSPSADSNGYSPGYGVFLCNGCKKYHCNKSGMSHNYTGCISGSYFPVVTELVSIAIFSLLYCEKACVS